MKQVDPLLTVLNSHSLFITIFQIFLSLTAQTKSLVFCADKEVALLFAEFAATPTDVASAAFLVHNELAYYQQRAP